MMREWKEGKRVETQASVESLIVLITVALPFRVDAEHIDFFKRALTQDLAYFYGQRLRWDSEKSIKVNLGRLKERILNYLYKWLADEFEMKDTIKMKGGALQQSGTYDVERFRESIEKNSLQPRSKENCSQGNAEEKEMGDEQTHNYIPFSAASKEFAASEEDSEDWDTLSDDSWCALGNEENEEKMDGGDE